MAKKKSNLEELLAKAKAAPARASNVWQPKAGDSITGEVTKLQFNRGRVNNETKERAKYLSLTLVNEHGEPWVVNCGYLLEQELTEQGVAVGDSVAIIYEGVDKTASGNKIHTYKCAVEKA